MAANPDECQKCHKSKTDNPEISLKRCSKCKSAMYCSRDCQKADWKEHKKVCASPGQAQSSASGSNNALIADLDKPFHALQSKEWLHNRPEQDVYTLLIDTYRFRMEDNYTLEGDVDFDSVYGGATDGGRAGFRRFLKLPRRELLPTWWNNDKAKECLDFGMRSSGGWSELGCAIEKSDIIEHYGNGLMPMQLRMFGEQVYGRGPGGQSGKEMLEMQVQVERGGSVMSTFDMSQNFRR